MFDPSLMVQQGPNPGERFAQAFQQGQQTARQNKARAAMAALVKDPTNANALAALAEVDPSSAMEFRQAAAPISQGAACRASGLDPQGR
jgi:ATP/maltotriose-dependent transcriptional regulator MalT